MKLSALMQLNHAGMALLVLSSTFQYSPETQHRAQRCRRAALRRGVWAPKELTAWEATEKTS